MVYLQCNFEIYCDPEKGARHKHTRWPGEAARSCAMPPLGDDCDTAWVLGLGDIGPVISTSIAICPDRAWCAFLTPDGRECAAYEMGSTA